LVTGLDRGLNQMMGDMWIQDRRGTKIPGITVAEVTIPAVLKKI